MIEMAQTKGVNGASSPGSSLLHQARRRKPSGGDHEVRTQNHPSPAPAGVTLDDAQLASKLEELEAALSEAPIVDQQRVEEFRRAIAAGAYRVDSARLAEKLVEFERMLSRLHE
jgi:negative regulator of flagellin synthesis FlgM